MATHFRIGPRPNPTTQSGRPVALTDVPEADLAEAACGPSTQYSCSQAQEQVWVAEQQNSGTSANHIVSRFVIDNEPSEQTMERTWQYLVARNAALRTRFVLSEGKPIQVIESHAAVPLLFYDLRDLEPSAAESEAQRIAGEEDRRPFDLAVAPLLRVCRITLDDRRSLVVIAAHRIICDERSLDVLTREMIAVASTLQRGESSVLADASPTYARICTAESDRLTIEPRSTEAGSPASFKQFELLTDRPRSAIHSLNGAIVSRLIEPESTAAATEVARTAESPVECVLLAALLLVLHRYSGETELGIGVEVSSRENAECDALVGNFVLTSPLLVNVSADSSFRNLVERTRVAMTRASGARHGSVDQLTHISINVGFDRTSHPRGANQEASGAEFEPLYTDSRFDLNFQLSEAAGIWRSSCEYRTDLYDSTTVIGVLERLDVVLRLTVDNAELPISRFPILTEAERQDLVIARNQTHTTYPSDRTVSDLLRAQALRTPDSIALICGEKQLSYAELDAASTRLAQELRCRGVGGGKRVGVLLERSSDLVVALVAVLKAGSAYVPLDPEYPRERLAFIVSHAQLSGVISRSTLNERIDVADDLFINVNTDASAIERNDGEPLADSVGPLDIAYVIYTSGSTGQPKGVSIRHGALVNVLYALSAPDVFDISADDVHVAVATISFDIATLELFLPLINGARLVVASDAEVADSGALHRLLQRTKATFMQGTPITWELLMEAGWYGDPALKILTGGEPISRRLADQLLERGNDVWNGYGPTETTIISSMVRVEPGRGPVLTGAPIANTQFYVLDKNGQLAPSGVVGELSIGGDGVAAGYFERPDLTQERFVPDTFRDVPNAKLYRTGDMVRRRGSSAFEFLGRSDDQVKIRGFRVELGEIEAALLRQPDVKEAVVVVRGAEPADKAIWAFIVPRSNCVEGSDAWIASLRSRLSQTLPHYMVPSRMGALPSLPRTPNGKIDRLALPQIRVASAAPQDPPATPVERAVGAMVCKMLGCERIGRNDNIFDRGFHSLLAIRLVQRIQLNFGIQLPLRALLDAPTIAALALRITAPESPLSRDESKDIYMLNPRGTRPPLFYFHSEILAEGMYCRTMAAPIPDQPIYVVAPHGTAGQDMLPTIEGMARDLLPRIRWVQPEGPYRLGGYCVGGFVAFEVARLLRAQGEIVERLVLINATAPQKRGTALTDRLIHAVGTNAHLKPGLRESLCANIARLGDAAASGPQRMTRFVAERLDVLWLRTKRRKHQMPHEAANGTKPFEMQRGTRATELYLEHVVAASTYRPEPYQGDVILLWGEEEQKMHSDPFMDWTSLVNNVRVVAIAGDHVSPLHDHAAELGSTLAMVLL